MQDCVATIPPYPYYIGDRDGHYDVAAAISDPDSLWIVRPQLFFSCTLRPLTARVDRYNNLPDDIPLNSSGDEIVEFVTCFQVLQLWTTTYINWWISIHISILKSSAKSQKREPKQKFKIFIELLF
jgi:hypothetical protein